MNVEEFKKRAVRSLIRDKYFYIPTASAEPMPKVVRFVVSEITPPTLPYSPWRYNTTYNEMYLYTSTTTGTVMIRDTPQGDVEADYANDEAFRCGIIAYDDMKETTTYDTISCIKVYNSGRYLGYFTYIALSASNNRYFYVDPNDTSRTYTENVRRIAIVPNFGSSHRIIHYREDAPCIKTCNLTPYGITRDMYSTALYLDANYNVVTSSSANLKYKESWSEHYYHNQTTNNGQANTTTSSGVFSIYTTLNREHTYRIYPITDNAYDVELYKSGHNMRDECQVDIPEIRTPTSTRSISTVSRMPMYYNSQDLPASEVIDELPTDLQPEEVTSTRYYFYYGDGMTKAMCSLYQTVLKLNDPSLVGGESISVECESP